MTQAATSPRARLHETLDSVFDRFRFAPSVAIGLLNIGGGVCIGLIGDLSTLGQRIRLAVGIVLLLLGLGVSVLVEWWRRQTELGQGIETAQFTVAVSNVLQPLSSRISALALNDSATRQRQLEGIISEAANSLLLLFKNADTPRATVYKLDSTGRKMTSAFHCGRTDKPGSFKNDGGARGAGAFDMVLHGSSKLVPSINIAGKRYHGYVSAAIICEDMGYGMLTIDSLSPDDFTPADEQLVVLIATLLGAAFAGTYRSRDALKLSGNP
ncbi:hypothetical protein BIU95_10335 [Curtobacterium sp. MCBA15_007]|uniref:hypothetical protein n=1 Tax=Curtobacterium sp. MCBA15_007 TaxID=1898735 RepID=UPI0008DE213D|nr:hypothetical protein [Curtobacterium sp. MCBA15_007]OII07789.1 hypothetical protein BIU95_10335 [Curtobacterium sp. MCBA15_007]